MTSGPLLVHWADKNSDNSSDHRVSVTTWALLALWEDRNSETSTDHHVTVTTGALLALWVDRNSDTSTDHHVTVTTEALLALWADTRLPNKIMCNHLLRTWNNYSDIRSGIQWLRNGKQTLHFLCFMSYIHVMDILVDKAALLRNHHGKGRKLVVTH